MLDLREAANSLDRRACGPSNDEAIPPIDDAAHYLRPYLDSASWLYLEADPIMRIANPVMHPHIIEYAMPPPKRKAHRHRPLHNQAQHCQQHHRHRHHHHHQHYDHHQHRHRRNHRRVASDPGRLGNNGNNKSIFRQHRRVFSLDDNNVIAGLCLVEATITEASEETPSPDEATRTLTFRKVPWHPNLHMLKTRQS